MSFAPMLKYRADHLFYQELTAFAVSIVENEINLVANLANLSSLIFHSLPNLNWAGFYLWSESDQELILGPFQGKPACIRIKPSRGVCGKSYSEQKVLNVSNVNDFPDHIACDSESLSELVIPIIINQKCLGVLDLDSPLINNFSLIDQQEMEKLIICMAPKIFK